MVDSKAKGRTAESAARDILRRYTGLKWERTPLSGALDERHGLKGDLYIPNKENVFCVEVKHYKDDHLTSKILTSKSPTLYEWWAQTEREATQVNRQPLLLFKYNRSKWFVAVGETYLPDALDHLALYRKDTDSYVFVYLLEAWLSYMSPKDFVNG